MCSIFQICHLCLVEKWVTFVLKLTYWAFLPTMPYFKQYSQSSWTNHSGTTTLKQFVSMPHLGHQWKLTGINAMTHCENEYLCVWSHFTVAKWWWSPTSCHSECVSRRVGRVPHWLCLLPRKVHGWIPEAKHIVWELAFPQCLSQQKKDPVCSNVNISIVPTLCPQKSFIFTLNTTILGV